MRVALVVGDWSRNIGNAFFQLGAQWLLQEAFPGSEIVLISDQPGYPSYWNRKGGNPSNSLDMAAAARSDVLVLVGPIFRPEIFEIWSESLRKVRAGGTQLLMLGIGAMDYSGSSLDLYRRFLNEFPPAALISRDRETFEALGELATASHDGIDLGFLLPEIYRPLGLERVSPYLALNFDKIPEPEFRVRPAGDGGSSGDRETVSPLDRSFEFDGKRWAVRFPKRRLRLARRSRYFMFLEGALFPGNTVDRISYWGVVRTDHRPHPMLRRKTYRYPNVMVNDTPYPYLEIYSGAEATFSNRMHACVAALAYGRPAMLFYASSRSTLLDRVGAVDIRSRPVYLDMDRLEAEKRRMVEFLRDAI